MALAKLYGTLKLPVINMPGEKLSKAFARHPL